MKHELKTISKYFKDVCCGIKTFEVRKNDRNFQVGDVLCLKEIDDNKKYTGRWCPFMVTYMLDNSDFCKKGYVILGIERIHM